MYCLSTAEIAASLQPTRVRLAVNAIASCMCVALYSALESSATFSFVPFLLALSPRHLHKNPFQLRVHHMPASCSAVQMHVSRRVALFIPVAGQAIRRSSFLTTPPKTRPITYSRPMPPNAVLRQPPGPLRTSKQPVPGDSSVCFVDDGEETYHLPPPEIARLVDARSDPVLMLQSASHEWLVMLQRPSLPPITEVAAEELRLAGFRINAATYSPSRADYFIGINMQRVDDQSRKQWSVAGLPPPPGNSTFLEMGYVKWAPNGKRFAFCIYDPAVGLELWSVEVETRRAECVLPGLRLNAVCGDPFTWTSDSKTIIAKFVCEERKVPEKSPVPKGPLIQENLSTKPAPSRTFQDLLKSAHDVALFEHYTRCQLGLVDVENCEMKKIGRPAAFRRASPSPDGKYLLVDAMVQPFMYMMPAGRFPRQVEVWNIGSGERTCVVAEIPLQDKIPIAFDGVGEGPRGIGWRADAPATLYWAEAQDGGDPNVEAEIRDCIFTLEAPFTGSPRKLASLKWRYSGIMWGSDSAALIQERRYKTRSTRSYLMAPGPSDAESAPGGQDFETVLDINDDIDNGVPLENEQNLKTEPSSNHAFNVGNGVSTGNSTSNGTGLPSGNNASSGNGAPLGSAISSGSSLAVGEGSLAGEMATAKGEDSRVIDSHAMGPCCARACDLSQGEAPKRLIIDIPNWEDRYNDPGSVSMTRNEAGKSVLRLIFPHGRQETETGGVGRPFFMMQGAGASEDGDRPFLNLFDTVSGAKTTVWRSSPPKFESVAAVLKEDKETGAPELLVVRQESQKENPNFFVLNVKAAANEAFEIITHPDEKGIEEAHDASHSNDSLQAITTFPHPAPDLVDVQREIVYYERSDGVRLNGSLYLPPGHDCKTDGPLPVFIWAYPREYKSAAFAGQTKGSPHRFVRLARTPLYWLTRGYAILDGPEMPIIGEGETEANDTYVEQLVSSAEAAVDFLVERGIGERGRVAIGGHSYGAFMAANLLAHAPDLFCCGIARSGAYNRTLTPFGFQSEERTLWQARNVYADMSPYMYADKIKSPLLLIHGDADSNPGTFPMQSERMYQALKGHGKVCRFVNLPHEGHGYRARESVMHVLAEMTAWLDKYCKPEEEIRFV